MALMVRVSAVRKPGKVRAAVDRVDVVGKAEDGFGVAVVVLQRDLDCDAVALGFHVDRLFVQNLTCRGSDA